MLTRLARDEAGVSGQSGAIGGPSLAPSGRARLRNPVSRGDRHLNGRPRPVLLAAQPSDSRLLSVRDLIFRLAGSGLAIQAS